MFHFTPQERHVLIFLLAIILTSQFIIFVSHKWPDAYLLVEEFTNQNDAIKTDVNKASKDQLVALPYIGEYTARKIIDYRNQFGRFESLDEIAQVPGVRKDLYDQFVIYLKIGPT